MIERVQPTKILIPDPWENDDSAWTIGKEKQEGNWNGKPTGRKEGRKEGRKDEERGTGAEEKEYSSIYCPADHR